MGKALFRLAAIFEAVDLLALAVYLTLLSRNLRLCLRIAHFLILQLIAHQQPGSRAKRATYRRACSWRAYCRTDNRAGTGTDRAAGEGALLTGRKWRARASADDRD